LSTAYVLILLDYDYPDDEVMSQLNMLPSVVEVNRVEGPYDIVVKLSDDNMSVLKESIGKYMIRIRGIQSTLTLMEEWLFRVVSRVLPVTGQTHEARTTQIFKNERVKT
jgi:DNA-binding Lrp family transcriptional regulator